MYTSINNFRATIFKVNKKLKELTNHTVKLKYILGFWLVKNK